jgi:hypothetical protein
LLTTSYVSGSGNIARLMCGRLKIIAAKGKPAFKGENDRRPERPFADTRDFGTVHAAQPEVGEYPDGRWAREDDLRRERRRLHKPGFNGPFTPATASLTACQDSGEVDPADMWNVRI